MLRFSPSPTNEFNIGSLRIALLNYIISKQKNKELIIRIEDIDKNSVIEGKDKEILELLNLFSIEYKHAQYQSDNLKYHQKLAMQLMTEKKAFACFCSDEKLKELEDKAKNKGKVYSYDDFCSTLSDETVLNCNAPFTVRIKKPNESIEFTDSLMGLFCFKPFEVDSFFILNHDKTPTYNYACAIDDMLFDTTTIIRDEKHLLNTARQIFVRNQLNYTKDIEYIHIPSIKNSEISVQSLIDDGFLPAAIANYLVILDFDTPKEIFTLEEAIEWFDILKISKKPISFDIEKLKDINKKHLENIDDLRLSKILGFADIDIGKLGKLYLNEAKTINEIKSSIDLIFSEKTLASELGNDYNIIKNSLINAPYFDTLELLNNYVLEKTNLDEEIVEKSLKVLITNRIDGPSLSNIYPLIKNYLGEIVK